MLFDCPPAFGFGHAKKCELAKDDRLITPGPGKYNNKSKSSLNGWKFGSSTRDKKDDPENPGPGSYNMRFKFPDGPAYSMSSKAGLKEYSDSQITPGPGSYKLDKIDQSSSYIKSSSYTFGSKYKEKNRDKTPGPGNYNLRTEKDLMIPSSIFGHEKRNEPGNGTEVTPGPGNYEYNADGVRTKHPNYSFSKDSRLSKDTNFTPGPGAYKHREYVGQEGSKISMSLKLNKSRSTDNIPGPGQYKTNNVDFVLKQSPNVKIGKAQRFSSTHKSLDDGPGPGTYNDMDSLKSIKYKKPSWRIGTSVRKPLSDIGFAPGPGNYNLRKQLGEEAPSYSMRIKGKVSGDRYETPGPGRYKNEEMNMFKHYPSWKIGTGQRDDALERKIKDNVPGPGAYESTEKHLLAAPMYRFGTQKRYKDKLNDYPGPGSYHIPCRVVDVNSYTRDQGKFEGKYKFI